MSYSAERTRKRLPLYYLALPFSAAVVWLLPDHLELLAARHLYLLPLWVALAHPLVGMSYLITARSARSARALLRQSPSVYGADASVSHLQAALLVALAEEIVFRYAALCWLADAFGSSLASLLLTSAAFAAVHLLAPGRKRSLGRLLDMLVFALIVGGLVLWMRSLYPALLLHATRNYILRCLLVSREEYRAMHRPGRESSARAGGRHNDSHRE